MKKTIGLIFAALLLVAGLSANSSAQTTRYRHNINTRERSQQQRIRQGVRSGSLTRSEAYRLEKREANLRRVEAGDRRSGRGLSRSERRNLERRENRTSRAIYRQKHDSQRRNYTRP